MLLLDKESRTFFSCITQLCKNTGIYGFPQFFNVMILRCCHTPLPPPQILYWLNVLDALFFTKI